MASTEESNNCPEAVPSGTETNVRLGEFRCFPTREQALETLHGAYDTMTRTTDIRSCAAAQRGERSSDIVLLSGVSGTGKSTLIKHFLADLKANATKKADHAAPVVYPYVLQGKYDEVTGGSSRPFSGIIEAFTGFAHTLEFEDAGGSRDGPQKEVRRLQEAIQQKLGEEASFLSTIIPELADLIGAKDNTSSSPEDEQGVVQHGNAWNRLRYIFQAFTAAISTKERPVVLILDDLQWMDSASIELLQALLCDQSLKHFMFVGLYRSNEVTPDHELQVALESVRKTIKVKPVELSNLDLSEMTSFLSESLQCPAKQTASLAKSLFEKTEGNLFFTFQILDDLKRKEVLKYSPSTSSWTWSQDFEESIDLPSIDLQGILEEKMKSASSLLQKILTIMAYTKSSLDIGSLRELMELNGWGVSVEKLVDELTVGVSADLLTNKVGSPVYAFAHDNIQNAAYELVPAGEERDQYRIDMGLRLVNLHEQYKRDWQLFAGANHLNATADRKTAKSIFLLKINVRAGERAQAVAAFDAAADFLGRAIKIVETQPNPWETSYNSTLCLYHNLAAVEFCKGRVDAGNRLADILLRKATSTDDKIPTMQVMAKALSMEQRHGESNNFCMKTLNLMKMYPTSSLRRNALFLRDMAGVHRFWRESTNEQILRLPTLRDKRKIAAIEILGTCGVNSLLMGDDITMIRTTLRSVRLSFKYGICSHGITSYIGLLVMRLHLGDFEGAKRVDELLRSISKRMKVSYVTARVMAGVSYHTSAWHQPPLKVLKDYERGYKAGMACGDHEWAAVNGNGYCLYQWLAGYPLSIVGHRFGRLITEPTTQNVASIRLLAEQWHFCIQVLQGKLPFDFDSFVGYGATSQSDTSDKSELLTGYLCRMMLGVFFGRNDLAETMLAKLKKLSGEDFTFGIISFHTLYASLMYLSLYHERGHKRNRNRAKPYIRRLETFTNGLGTNNLHRLKIIKAHADASRHTTLASVKLGYDDAVRHCVKTGHVQDAGLACQMAAQFLSSRMAKEKFENTTESTKLDVAHAQYLKRAVNYYKKWGADAVVDHIKRQYEERSSVRDEDASKRTDSSISEEWAEDVDAPTLFDF